MICCYFIFEVGFSLIKKKKKKNVRSGFMMQGC